MTAVPQITVVVNGEPRQTGARTVADLIRELGLEGRPVAVEVNKSCVPHRKVAERYLADGDLVEMVSLVGGG